MSCSRYAALLLLAGWAQAQTLPQAIDAAALRDPESRALAAKDEAAAAREALAARPFAGPGAVSLGGRSDRLHRDTGAAEYEVEVGFPLWLPGQRDAQQSAAAGARAAVAARRAAARLRLAGEVREAWYGVALAAGEHALAQGRHATLLALETDLARRLRAGEVSRYDANVGAQERLAAAAQVAEAALRADEARARAKALTGLDLGGDPPAEGEAGAGGEHAQLALAQADESAARAAQAAARSARRDNPEVALALRRERGEFGEPWAHSLALRVRIPFAAEPRVRAETAQAGAAVERAAAERALLGARLASDQEVARAALAAARAQADFAAEALRLAADNRELARRAYAQGEFDLPARLRAENAAFEAERAALRARVNLGLARGRLNQAYGVSP